MDFQIIVICISDERKMKTQKVLEKLNIPVETKIHFLDASTPNNSQEFLSGIPDEINEQNRRVMCCAKSHLRALELAYSSTAPNYTIIIEDDVTFYKYGSIDIIREIIKRWETDTNYLNKSLIHIGWVPCNHHDKYKNKKMIDRVGEFKFYECFYCVGTQGYIIKKSMVNKAISDVISSNTYNEYCNNAYKYCSYFFTKSELTNENVIPIDHFLPRLYNNFLILFPPLIIERNEESLLGHENKKDYWDVFFKDVEYKLLDYI